MDICTWTHPNHLDNQLSDLGDENCQPDPNADLETGSGNVNDSETEPGFGTVDLETDLELGVFQKKVEWLLLPSLGLHFESFEIKIELY